MKPKCGIVYNGHLQSDKFMVQLHWLSDTAKRHGFEPELIGNHRLIPAVIDGRCTLLGPYADYRPDFFFFWDKDIRLARHLEKMGFRLFNSASSIEICDDKSRTYEVLAEHGVTMPKTVTGPLLYEGFELEDVSSVPSIVAELGLPLVLKEAYGSFGEQVYLIASEEELIGRLKSLGAKPYVLQELVASSYGRDVRINVVGGEAAAAMLRRSETDFRANVTAGGRMFPYEPTDEEKAFAVRCAELVGADFAGVDLLFGPDGEPVLCEINSNAHFKNIFDCTGVDLAEAMFRYIRSVLYAADGSRKGDAPC
ncbi:RimK family alpha-L-glutamate ligase [Paenibacillus sp. YYML68]|uniref:ATP-grasp domain-containing protein n=1 Tax=Paenibacillus sp. YYML68 TaxID=2909250 RepID=UPI002493508A|nr:RimK family alpha-L-glutamate ligase [Paenibacillus sp. YYML68]